MSDRTHVWNVDGPPWLEAVYFASGALVSSTLAPAGPSPMHVSVPLSQYPWRTASHHGLLVTCAPNAASCAAFASPRNVTVTTLGAVRMGPPWSTSCGHAGCGAAYASGAAAPPPALDSLFMAPPHAIASASETSNVPCVFVPHRDIGHLSRKRRASVVPRERDRSRYPRITRTIIAAANAALAPL